MKKNLLLVATLLLTALPALAQKNKTIRVEGSATLFEVPEMVVTSLDVEVRGDVYNECFEESLEMLSTLKKRFKRNGIKPESIKSDGISVRERYEWNGNKRVLMGFESEIRLEIKEVFTEKFSEALLESLSEEDLNMNYRIRFEFSEAQKAEIRKKSIELAVADAMQKAEIIAAAAGLQLTGVDNIGYSADSNQYSNSIMTMDCEVNEEAKRAVGFRFSDVDLNPKEQSITRKINVVYSFE